MSSRWFLYLPFFSWTVAVVYILVYLSRNRLSPRFINKATTAEPIQGDEESSYEADQR
jgi:hypothetical protein